jgi:hypothetical protein
MKKGWWRRKREVKVEEGEDEEKKTKLLSFFVTCIPVILEVSYVILGNVSVFFVLVRLLQWIFSYETRWNY